MGSFLLFMIKFPDKDPQHIDIALHDLLLSITLVCIIVPMFFQKKKSRHHKEDEPVDRQKGIMWPVIGSAFFLMILFRILF
jgi:hypothetical protein